MNPLLLKFTQPATAWTFGGEGTLAFNVFPTSFNWEDAIEDIRFCEADQMFTPILPPNVIVLTLTVSTAHYKSEGAVLHLYDRNPMATGDALGLKVDSAEFILAGKELHEGFIPGTDVDIVITLNAPFPQTKRKNFQIVK